MVGWKQISAKKARGLVKGQTVRGASEAYIDAAGASGFVLSLENGIAVAVVSNCSTTDYEDDGPIVELEAPTLYLWEK